MSILSLGQLQTFADVIELGSFSAAADRLNISQPAVSLQIRQLEKHLGVRLIDRVGRRARPTAAGEELLIYARQMEALARSAVDNVARFASGTVGRVRLGTTGTACIHLLPSIMQELRQRFPSLDLMVQTGSTPKIIRAIEDNTIDVGLVTLPAAGRALDITPIITEELVAVAAADDTRLPQEVTPEALAQLPTIMYTSGGSTRWLMDDWFARAGFTLKPAMELGVEEAIKELVGAGLGYSILPAIAVGGPRDHLPVIARPLSPRLYRQLALVLRKDKPVTPGMRELMNRLQAVGTATELRR